MSEIGNLYEILQGLTILASGDPHSGWVTTYRGVLYGPPATLTDEEIDALENLGWYFNEIVKCWAFQTA